ncbi:hypothetical protein B0H14DRAFT_2567895 [Mycena olivaceomarginata]|nr:hypothetical protein B0H14DRAFT_2567895 [Mycena olivaceomarginata]
MERVFPALWIAGADHNEPQGTDVPPGLRVTTGVYADYTGNLTRVFKLQFLFRFAIYHYEINQDITFVVDLNEVAEDNVRWNVYDDHYLGKDGEFVWSIPSMEFLGEIWAMDSIPPINYLLRVVSLLFWTASAGSSASALREDSFPSSASLTLPAQISWPSVPSVPSVPSRTLGSSPPFASSTFSRPSRYSTPPFVVVPARVPRRSNLRYPLAFESRKYCRPFEVRIGGIERRVPLDMDPFAPECCKGTVREWGK